jgi:hypothetical protein
LIEDRFEEKRKRKNGRDGRGYWDQSIVKEEGRGYWEGERMGIEEEGERKIRKMRRV